MEKKVNVYTDGACSGNPGKGGWAAVIVEGRKEKIISGSEKLTTNNKMELAAVINALKIINSYEINIFTDSKYVKNGIENWINNWKINGWMTVAKQPVKNKELWVQLDTLVNGKKVKWEWVKGHSNDYYNNIADEEARKAIG